LKRPHPLPDNLFEEYGKVPKPFVEIKEVFGEIKLASTL
jgi:hypothetical protein